MKKLVEFPLNSGGSIVVEVDEPVSDSGMVEAARPGEIAQRASKTLEEALDKVQPAAEAIIARLGEISQKPNEIEIEFGLKLSGDIGAIIASAKVEANYVVKLKWTKAKNNKPNNSADTD